MPTRYGARGVGFFLSAFFTLLLVACSGGGGGGGSSSTTTTATITPFKGKFTSGSVALADANGKTVALLNGTGAINSNGTAQVTYTNAAAYPVFISVSGTYLDEVSGGTSTVTSSAPLRGIIPDALTATTGVPVTAITEIAVAQLQSQVPALTGITSTLARNAITASASGVLGQTYNQAMTPPVFDNQGRTSDSSTLQLAALAVVANTQGTGADLAGKLKNMATQLASGSAVNVVIPQTLYNNAVAAVNGGVKSLLPAGTSAPSIGAVTPSSSAIGSIMTTINTTAPTGTTGTGLSIVKIAQTSGIIGSTIDVFASGLKSTSPSDYLVTFGINSDFLNSATNVSATPTAVSLSMNTITVVVPVGAKTGKIMITPKGGAGVRSTEDFVVTTPIQGDGTLKVTGAYFTSLYAMTSRPNLDSASIAFQGVFADAQASGINIINPEHTIFGRTWAGDTGIKGVNESIFLLYSLYAAEDLLSVSVEDPKGNSFSTGPGKPGNPLTCFVKGTNNYSYPDCASWGISVNRQSGIISFSNTPVFDSLSPTRTGTISGTFNFTPITVANGVLINTPTITNVSPSMAPVGAPVTITGTNFDSVTPANNVVAFNGIKATIKPPVTSTQLTVVVPVGATSGDVTVVTPGGSADSLFTVGNVTTTVPGQTGTIYLSCYAPKYNFCQDYYIKGANCGTSSLIIASAATCKYDNPDKVLIGTCITVGAFTTNFYSGYPIDVAQSACASQPNGVWHQN